MLLSGEGTFPQNQTQIETYNLLLLYKLAATPLEASSGTLDVSVC